MPTTLLIDGDIIAYKVAAACEEAVDWGNDFWTLHADAMEGKAQVDTAIADLKENLKATEAELFLSGKKNFRHDLFEDYKANRKTVRKPMILPALREHLLEKWSASIEEGIEADDLIGIAATSPEANGSIVVSVDKDFKAIPCKLYNPDKPELGVEDITEGAADRHHMFQTLVGDSSDNYKGCPSVGPVKANKILDDCDGAEEIWEAVLKNFDKAGLSSKHALVQARLARILRHGEYDFETRKVKLWQPTKQK
tara:strand:- start:9206 stop:9964 length:759 start_codon:yes stop_codon:yes gene_type:complete